MNDPQERALLAAVLAEPGDDSPRLILADYLGERGGPGDAERAEFIRVQCRLAEMRAATDAETSRPGQRTGIPCRHRWPEQCCDCRDLLRRESQLWLDSPLFLRLLAGMPDGWRLTDGKGAALPDHPSPARGFVWRGFVHTVHLPLADWLEHGPAVVAAHPVERVEATGKAPTQVRAELRVYDEWRWFRRAPAADALLNHESDLPSEVFDILRGGSLNQGNWCRHYPTREAARDALSDALLAHAKGAERA